MAEAYRVNRKASDEQITRLNNMGLSLTTMGTILGCHPSTITQRLKLLGLTLSDNRKSFVDYVFEKLTDTQKQSLEDYLYTGKISIKDYLTQLVQKDLDDRSSQY